MTGGQFSVEVEDIGTFTFRHRTMRDELKIGGVAMRLTDGMDVGTSPIGIFANHVAALQVLTVSALEGWDPMPLDPLDQESYDKVIKVARALGEREAFFRQRPAAAGADGGKAARA